MTRFYYRDANISQVSVDYTYGDAGEVSEETTRDVLTNGSPGGSMAVTYKRNNYGDVIERDGPGTTAAPGPVLGWAYDQAGRVIAVAAAAIDTATTPVTVTRPVVAFEYIEPSTQSPAARRVYSFSWDPTATAPYSYTGGVPNTDDVVQAIEYFDPAGRMVQTRTRLGTGISGSSVNVVRHLAAQYRVSGNVIFDGLGRTTALLDPYFSSTASYVDPRSATELSTAGLHATSLGYDAKSRKVCEWYAPVSGAIVPAATDPSACTSNSSETASYRRATSTLFGVDTSLGRAYLTTDLTPDWNQGSGAVRRQYFDAAGRLRYEKSPSGSTYVETDYDPLGRPLQQIRWAGAPQSGTPSVASSWTYDLRGRVANEDSGAGGKRWYSYRPTGEISQVLQNATNTSLDQNAVWTAYVVGTFGRPVEIQKHRYTRISDCNAMNEMVDVTTMQYDTAYLGQTGWYAPSGGGVLTGRPTALRGAAATIAFGYDARGLPNLRDEWTDEAGVRQNSVRDTYGGDGRLLSRSFSSSYFPSDILYNVKYDSVGHPVQLTDGGGTNVYWQAGTGSADPVTGPYDSLNRLATMQWDSGLGATTNSFYPNSNLPSGYTSTLPDAAGTRFNVYSSQSMTWQGSLLSGYTVTSNWEGGGTSYAASYDLDGHLRNWSAAALTAAVGPATQQFNETYGFSLENIQSVTATNNLGLTTASNYAYDPTLKERVTSVSVSSTNAVDYFDYDRRGRGLITAHRISATQNPPQDSYEYDVDARLISISKLGAKVEDLAYGPDGQLVARTFTNGADTARYYVGDHMTLVRRGTTMIGYAHIYVGATRIASAWSKATSTATTSGTIYYHRNEQRSVVATTTAGGQVGLSYRYLPAGAIDKVIGTEADESASELGFTGGLKLSGGLIHFKARAYSPALRRFLQPDTIDLRRYTYVQGDPVNFIDPTGRGGICGQLVEGGVVKPCNANDYREGDRLPSTAPTFGEVAQAIGNWINTNMNQGDFSNDQLGQSVNSTPAGLGWATGPGSLSGGAAGNGMGGGAAGLAGDIGSGRGSTSGAATSFGAVAQGFYSNHPVAFWAGSLAVGAAAAAIVAFGWPAVVVSLAVAAPAAEGIGLRFTQTTASVTFKSGAFAGQTIGRVAAGLRVGTIQASQVPIDIVVRSGQTLAMNTRSALALVRAGVPMAEWTIVNRTGDAFFEELLTERLAQNGLPSLGTEVLRITGAGPNASAIW